MANSLVERFDREVGRYRLAAHAGRVAIAVGGLVTSVATADDVPIEEPFGVVLAFLGVMWTVGLAAGAEVVHEQCVRRPWLLWIDVAVLCTLMALDKPWDSLTALPFGAFVLLVAYGRPSWIVGAVFLTVAAAYLPKLVALGVDWRHADDTFPVSTADWLTQYVGPVFAGTITWALCTLLVEVRRAVDDFEDAEAGAAQAERLRARARARHALADKLHEALSQVMKAVILRLGGPAPAGLDPGSAALYREAVAIARSADPVIRRLTGDLRRDPAGEASGPAIPP